MRSEKQLEIKIVEKVGLGCWESSSDGPICQCVRNSLTIWGKRMLHRPELFRSTGGG